MSSTRSEHRKNEKYIKILVGLSQERDSLEGLGDYGNIALIQLAYWTVLSGGLIEICLYEASPFCINHEYILIFLTTHNTLPVLNFLFRVHVMVDKCLMSADNLYVDRPRLFINHKYIVIFSITQNT